VFENRVFRKIFGPKMDKTTKAEENDTMRSFIIYILHQILFV
jgi:hypothetical protein